MMTKKESQQLLRVLQDPLQDQSLVRVPWQEKKLIFIVIRREAHFSNTKAEYTGYTSDTVFNGYFTGGRTFNWSVENFCR